MIGNLWLVPGLFAFLLILAAAKDWRVVANGQLLHGHHRDPTDRDLKRAASSTWLSLLAVAATMAAWVFGQFYG